jgi:hypothetical protein
MSNQRTYSDLVLDLLADGTAVSGQMMGMPVLKLSSSNKVFAGFFGDALALKVGKERADELIEAGEAEPFDPSGEGRPMQDWASVREPVSDWLDRAREAESFVRESA